MRANRSWPRSSVPNGCAQDGIARRAPKSMSLIGICQTSAPAATATIIKTRMARLATASRCRRKRRHASPTSVTWRKRPKPTIAASAVRDAGVEPAIEDIGEQVEQDHEAGEDERHRHDNRRVVGQDRTDQERPDTRDPKNLLSDNGAAEHRRHR